MKPPGIDRQADPDPRRASADNWSSDRSNLNMEDTAAAGQAFRDEDVDGYELATNAKKSMLDEYVQAEQNALISSLFKSLGTAGGGALSGALGKGGIWNKV